MSKLVRVVTADQPKLVRVTGLEISGHPSRENNPHGHAPPPLVLMVFFVYLLAWVI
jgi:hypothetical protein